LYPSSPAADLRFSPAARCGVQNRQDLIVRRGARRFINCDPATIEPHDADEPHEPHTQRQAFSSARHVALQSRLQALGIHSGFRCRAKAQGVPFEIRLDRAAASGGQHRADCYLGSGLEGENLAGGSPPETIMCRAVSGIPAPRGTSAAMRLTFQAVVVKPDPWAPPLASKDPRGYGVRAPPRGRARRTVSVTPRGVRFPARSDGAGYGRPRPDSNASEG
jgi:hypothetical protein